MIERWINEAELVIVGSISSENEWLQHKLKGTNSTIFICVSVVCGNKVEEVSND